MLQPVRPVIDICINEYAADNGKYDWQYSCSSVWSNSCGEQLCYAYSLMGLSFLVTFSFNKLFAGKS